MMAWKSRFEEWSRPPEPSPDASGILVQLPRAATACEFDLVPEPGQVMQRARTSDAKQHKSAHGSRSMNHHARLTGSPPCEPSVHLNYAETVLPMRDGLPKLKDSPAAVGGSGEMVPE